MKIGLIHSTIREDEKLIIQAARHQNVEVETIDVREQILNPVSWRNDCDLFLERCISRTLGMHSVMFFESTGVPVVNSFSISSICENKFLTSLTLARKNVSTVQFALVFSEKEAKEAVKQLGGYPIVLKPVAGSWGRLLAKINDQDGLEAVIEQKMILGSPTHKALYIQKYVDKKGRDIRVTAVGDKVICAIYRESDHWITNTARGAKASICRVNRALKKISLSASHAVGGGILGIDVFETDEGYTVNEVNHTPEFKNVQRITGIDVAGEIIDYCKEVQKV